jgi:hypothetical protein
MWRWCGAWETAVTPAEEEEEVILVGNGEEGGTGGVAGSPDAGVVGIGEAPRSVRAIALIHTPRAREC